MVRLKTATLQVPFFLNAYQVHSSDYENVLPTSVNVVWIVDHSTD